MRVRSKDDLASFPRRLSSTTSGQTYKRCRLSFLCSRIVSGTCLCGGLHCSIRDAGVCCHYGYRFELPRSIGLCSSKIQIAILFVQGVLLTQRPDCLTGGSPVAATRPAAYVGDEQWTLAKLRGLCWELYRDLVRHGTFTNSSYAVDEFHNLVLFFNRTDTVGVVCARLAMALCADGGPHGTGC